MHNHLGAVLLDNTLGSIVFNSVNSCWEERLAEGVRRQYPKGSIIIHAGQIVTSIFFLRSGTIKQFLVGLEGQEKVVGLIKAGNIFGEALFFHGYPAQCTNRAAEDVVLYVFSREVLDRMFSEDPRLMAHIARSISLKMRMLTTQIHMLHSLDAKAKVCRTLYFLAQQAPDGTCQLTHQEIAQLAGVHRVTVTSTLALLKRFTIIDWKDATLIVRDAPALCRYANGEKSL